MTKLSDHFSLEELTYSDTAVRLKLSNLPPTADLVRLTATAQAMEAVRDLLGKPIKVSSGYRGAALNKAVGGAKSSAHCFGYAVDFRCDGFGSPYDVCMAIAGSGIVFDQLIHEYGRWTHISFDPRRRKMPLSIFSAKRGYLNGILPVP
ncbi:MAG: D-Ala-D-Ala carboxypeptidase family metallohydrolase [Pseudomonadota bacterium]